MKFICSYAYDVPCYVDFTVEAQTEEQAQAILDAALKAGQFADVYGEPCWENAGDNERCFVQGPSEDPYAPGPLAEVPNFKKD